MCHLITCLSYSAAEKRRVSVPSGKRISRQIKLNNNHFLVWIILQIRFSRFFVFRYLSVPFMCLCASIFRNDSESLSIRRHRKNFQMKYKHLICLEIIWWFVSHLCIWFILCSVYACSLFKAFTSIMANKESALDAHFNLIWKLFLLLKISLLPKLGKKCP